MSLAETHPGGCYLSFNGEISRASIEQIVLMCGQAWENGFDEVTLCMNSPGGTLEHAYHGFNMLEALPIHIVTYNTSAVQSAANLLFLCGDERYACPGSMFFFHQTSFQSQGGLIVTEAYAKERLKAIQLEDARTAQIIANKTNQTVESVNDWQAQELLLSAEDAEGFGIVHGVRALAIPKDALFRPIVVQE